MRIVCVFLALSLLITSAAAADLTISVSGIRAGRGEIVARLYLDAKGFPSNPKLAVAEAKAPATSSAATLFMNIPNAGRYALIVIHDVNSDGAMEKTFLGLPEEGYGVSNNPRPLLVPLFSEAAFDIQGGAHSIEVELVYY